MAVAFVKSYGAATVESRFHALLSTTRVFAAIGVALMIGTIGTGVYFVAFRTGSDSANITDWERKAAADAKAEADRIAAQKAEADRIAAQKAEADRVAAQKAEAERKAAADARAEADRIAAQKAEAERKAAADAKANRIAAQKAAEKAQAERKAAVDAKSKADRIAAQKAADARAEEHHIQREGKRTKVGRHTIENRSGPRQATAPARATHLEGGASLPPQTPPTLGVQ